MSDPPSAISSSAFDEVTESVENDIRLPIIWLDSEKNNEKLILSYVSRSTELNSGEGISGELLTFKTGTVLDNTEIRV